MDDPSSITTHSKDSTRQMEASPELETLTPAPEARPTTPVPPALPPRPDKRALLLVYIHGFKGNETSFKEFPTVRLLIMMDLTVAFSGSYSPEIEECHCAYPYLSEIQDKTAILSGDRQSL